MANFANLEEKLSFAHPEYHLDATKQKLGDFIRVKTHFLANCILLHFFFKFAPGASSKENSVFSHTGTLEVSMRYSS